MSKLIIIILIITVISILYLRNINGNMIIKKEEPILDDKEPNVMERVNNDKLNIWLYCNDEKYNFKMNWRYPLLNYNYTIPFEKLCIDTYLKNLMNYDVDVIILNKNNIHDYVPDFPIRMNNSGYSQKKVIDLLGSYILEKYGGLWISPYTVVLNKDYNELISNVLNNEVVTFGTSPNIDNSSPTYGAVNNNIIGGKKGSKVMIAYKSLMSSFVFSDQYEYMYNHISNNPEPLGEAIKYSKPSHIHYTCITDGSYNMNDRKIHVDEFLGKVPIQFKDPEQLLFISFPYNELDVYTNYRWIYTTPYPELMTSDISIVEVAKQQLI